VLDFDDGTNPLEVTRPIDEQGYCYIIHTTHSHARELPKFRVVMPLAEPVSGAQWEGFWRRATAHFGNDQADKKAKDASRIYYVPSCPPEGESDAFSSYFPGTRLLHPDDVPAAPEPERKPATPMQAPAFAPGDLRPYVRAAFDRELQAVATAQNGCRNSTLNKSAFALGQFIAAGELEESHVAAALLHAATATGLPEAEARRTLTSGFSAGKQEPRRLPEPSQQNRPQSTLAAPPTPTPTRPAAQGSKAAPIVSGFAPTDTGNGERYAAQHGGDVKHTAGLGWLHYDAGRWIPDRTGEVQRRAKATAISINIEAGQTSDDGHRKQLREWAGKSESMAKRDAMIRAAQSEPQITALAEQFDANKWLFNTANGTIDLRTGKLQDHRREDLITKFSSVAFDPQAKCPTFRAFLSAIMGKDAALVEFVQRAVGYSLTGDTREQCFFVLHGNGSNGKSTLLDTLRELLGDYGMQTKPDTLLARREEGINNDVARLRGARFVTAVETGEGKRLAESKIKEMTGGDYITARFLFKENFDFKPEFKIFLATNHKPEIKGTDDGIWRRVRLIPFNVRFWNAQRGESGPPELRANKLLLEQLRAELPGILTWAVEGCLKWQRDGLTAPKAVLEATNKYREEEDVLGAFLKDCCVIGPKCHTTSKALNDVYAQWCEANGEKPISKIALAKKLQERGFIPTKTSIARGFQGVGLKVEGEKTG
jgi:P4 family phage/plasmid primase-like protien